MSILTGKNPFADYKNLKEAKVKIDIDDKEDQKTKQKESDNSKPPTGDEVEAGTDAAAGEVDAAMNSDDPDAMAAAGEEGMPDPENPGDLNGDGVVDMKDKKMAELEKDLRIRELERSIADIDDPEVEPGLKKAAPERPRIKNRGDHYAIINDAGEELEKIPFDGTKVSSREARYQALRRVDQLAAEMQADHTARIGDDKEGKLGAIDQKLAKDGEELDKNAEADPVVQKQMDDEKAEMDAIAKDKAMDVKKSAEVKVKDEKKPAPKKEKKPVKEETLYDLYENAKIMKMLKTMDKDEARILIQGLPKSLRAKAMKSIGLKEDDITEIGALPTKIDGRSKAFKETAKRIMMRKQRMMEKEQVQEDHMEEDLVGELQEYFYMPVHTHLEEKRMFVAAARAAYAKGDKTFLFNGREYPCTIKEAAKKGSKVKIDGDEYEIIDIEEARRGKNEFGEVEGPEHIIMQLRKAVSLRGKTLELQGGKKMKITDRDARKILQMYDQAKPNVKKAIQLAANSNEKAIKDMLSGKIPQVKKSRGPELPKLRSLGEAGYDNGPQHPNADERDGGEPVRSANMTGVNKMPKKNVKEYTGADFYADYIKKTTKK